MGFPLGEVGPCQIKFGGVDLGYTKGGVKFKDDTLNTEITYDQTGETVQDTVDKGKKVFVDVPLTNTSLALLEDLIAGAVLDTDGMKVSSSVGVRGRDKAKELILTLMDGDAPSADPDATLVIFKAAPTAKIDWGFDNSGQRITLVTFAGLPDDVSGNVNALYRVGLPSA